MLTSIFPFNKTTVRFLLCLALSLAFAIVGILVLPTHSRAKLNPAQLPTAHHKQQRPAFVPGEVLVRYRNESFAQSKTGRSTALTSEGVALALQIEEFGGSHLISGLRLARVAPEATLDAVAALRRQPEVLYAEPNYILRADVVPNDTHFVANRQSSLTRVNLPQAWDTTVGNRSIVVAVLDQGIKTTHVDLAANIWTNPMPGSVPGILGDVNGYNFVNNNGTVFTQSDDEYHATHVAGIIGAVGNNGTGITGVAWQVSLMSLRFLDKEGFGNTADAIRACQYAKAMRDLWESSGNTKGANIRVINASFGEKSFNHSFLDAVNALNSSGILFVAAAGNIVDGTREPNNELVPHYPSSYNAPNVIAVAATSATDALSNFSHFGATTVDLGAPGEDILSTTPPCANPGPPPRVCQPSFPVGAGSTDDTYTFLSGTSMSAPHVSGAAALLWSQNPTLTVQQVKNLLLLDGDIIPGLVDKTLTGRRLNVGNSFAALAENDTTAPGSPSNFRITSQNGRAISLGWTASGDDGNTGQAALYQLSFTDGTSNAVIPLKGVIPNTAGAGQLSDVKIPFRHTSGTLTVREFDNAGNEGTPVSLPVGIPLSSADPYTVTEGPAVGLSTGGTNLNPNDDDKYVDFAFPAGFTFPFFGSTQTTVRISTNGSLYFSSPPVRPGDGSADDVPSSPGAIGGQKMIAGLWDDLTLETSLRSDAGIFVTQSPTQLIFRWQGVPCNYNAVAGVCAGGSPVNFEIELNSNGVIKSRYGSGNTNLRPSVGIGGGEQDAYIITSHTSEETDLNLTSAGQVTYTPRAQTVSTIQLSQSTLSVNEDATTLTVTVTRSGDTVSVANVNYQTTDNDTFTVGCSDTVNNFGSAYGRCDYAAAIDTLVFAAGETSKTFTISIIDDSIAEGNETFGVSLSNPIGATLGAPSSATVTIVDNDNTTGANPIFTTPFFVRQHYLDFLSREPDAGGFAAWSNVLNNCSDVNNNPNCDRIVVSSSFFGSQEFQLKGYFVYRFYKLAFNRLPTYLEMVTDMRAVTGTTADEVFQKKAAYANAFVLRSEFTNLYGSSANSQYVSTLMGRYALTQITTPDPALPDGVNKVTLTSSDLTNRLNASTLTRAQVLRAIVDSDQVFGAEFNQAFVAMQYYGYLRRSPDSVGYNAWLNYLNANPTDFRTMVSGFMNSAEYRLRFGPSQ